MKLFSYIFGVYLLALLIMPCSDVHNDYLSETTKTTISENHNPHTDIVDLCSPFCICNCCSKTVTIEAINHSFKPTKQLISTKEKFPTKEFSYVYSFYGNIWQPPKIS